MYSSILPKYGICSDCPDDGIEKELIAGRCKFYHYKIHRDKLMLERIKEKNKFRSLKSLPANKTMLLSNGKIENNELELWFLGRMANLAPICDNCGANSPFLLEDRYKKHWRSCQAHLLPKSKFPSIMTHPLNGMVLGSGMSGMCNCHDFFDSAWSNAEKMAIWSEVVRRFKIMYPLITQKEYQYIPEQLIKHIPSR